MTSGEKQTAGTGELRRNTHLDFSPTVFMLKAQEKCRRDYVCIYKITDV